LFSAEISIQPNQNNNVSSFLCIYCGVGNLDMTSGVSHVLKCQFKSWKHRNFVSGSPKCSLESGMSIGSIVDKNPDLVFQFPFANYKTCEPAVFVQSDPPVFELYLNRFNRFNSEKKFSILHLNVASLLNKSYEINEIVNLRKFDIISAADDWGTTKSNDRKCHVTEAKWLAWEVVTSKLLVWDF